MLQSYPNQPDPDDSSFQPVFSSLIFYNALTSGLIFVLSALAVSCGSPEKTLFESLPSSATGINFTNKNVDSDTLSILDYLYYYNGAGVSAGDINNDGLPDLYFASNYGSNALYLNKGNFKFDDITIKAGVKGNAAWTTGVAMADINGDGLLDIYVSTVANHNPQDGNGSERIYFRDSRNQLFINNGDNTFTESAKKWGIDLQGYNTQAVFFDYDKDGDLDMFALQHSTHQTGSYGYISQRNTYSKVSGGKLYRNEGDHFIDVTPGSGIFSSALGYGLGVGVADLNHDGYDDIYVSNDFHEDDYYYVNQGNGHFKEMNKTSFAHESKFSMGNDIADINGDGWFDIVTMDMLPENEKVLKSSLGDDPLDVFMYQRRFGYNYQYSRNCLQLNTGRGKKFADIALYSGVSATDWSWSALIADFDLDGTNDLFVSNGIKKRPNDLDYLKFTTNLKKVPGNSGTREHDKRLIGSQPPGSWHNYLYKGKLDLQFADSSIAWGFGKSSLSQGSAYADLDGDGDLDLVTNNMNEEAGIYRNNSREWDTASNYLNILLKGPSPNTFGIGAKVFIFVKGKAMVQELQPVRGFMSSVEPLLHYGLGKNKVADSILVIWGNNMVQREKNIHANQKLIISYSASKTDSITNHAKFISDLLHTGESPVFSDITEASGLHFVHKENYLFIDFNSQWFLPHQLSTQGPKLTIADVNNDGLEDFYVCGARGQAGEIQLQNSQAVFTKSADSAVFMADADCEDVDALFFDADGDGDADLYVVSGGNEYTGNSPFLHDRLYLNNGIGRFSKSESLPALTENKSVARAADFDKDGDMDLFVGGRANSTLYGDIPFSYLLQNDGKANFTIVSAQASPSLEHIGMVTDAAWIDVDNDSWPDLLICGEWMPPVLYKNTLGKLKQQNISADDASLKGWWCSMKTIDVNGDGFDDLLLGNYGLNSKLKASPSFPIKMYVGDIADNKRPVQILSIAKEGKYYPFLGKENLEKQLPYLNKEFLSYEKIAGKTVEEIFAGRLGSAIQFEASDLASVLLVNNGKGGFSRSSLPPSLQWQPAFAFAPFDFNRDGKIDFMAGGNFYGTTPFEGRYDAVPLSVYLGDGKSSFISLLPLPVPLDGFSGEVRSIQPITLAGNKKALLVAFNNGPLTMLKY